MKIQNNVCQQLKLVCFSLLLLASCKKEASPVAAKSYSSEILVAWSNFDLRLLRANPTVLNNFIMLQHWAYSSIALYESLLPGMPDNKTLTGQLDQMPAMPEFSNVLPYHSPSTANAVLAEMIRIFYTGIPAADKLATDSLEAVFNAKYKAEIDPATFQRSVEFGKEIVQIIYSWSRTDGSKAINPVYVLPVGPGMYEKTPSGFLEPQNPYWGNNRPMVAGSVAASQIVAPPPYSTDPSSQCYIAAKEVYDASLVLTSAQKEQVIFWRDTPGGGHAHWLAIFLQVLNTENITLDKAAIINAKLGISQNDARISCWKSKYLYNVLRPVTYIRTVMGQPSWNAYINTPNHPEYPSAHSTFSSAASTVLSAEFGTNYGFTDHTYDFLGLPARTFTSFDKVTKDAGDSRVLGGLHFPAAIVGGNMQGLTVANYVLTHIKFKK